jgi:hypothetical protein
MRKASATLKQTAPVAPRKAESAPEPAKIHPVIVYPFHQPGHYDDLEALYQMVGKLDADRRRYTRPLTVVDRKTQLLMEPVPRFKEFRAQTVAKHSDILDAWCVDTCQMWYTGLGAAFESGAPQDVYWLIPGDFNYGTDVGREVLGSLGNLPDDVLAHDQDLCIGEIATDHNNSKQLIDSYGTFALLYNWFPAEAREIRQLTERPRSEFFAVRHSFLEEMIRQRWYPYEQTLVMMLHGVFNKKRLARVFVGNISDLPEGNESLVSAMQQVERTERVLKAIWREQNQSKTNWIEEYRLLESRSEQVRRSALTILQNVLG